MVYLQRSQRVVDHLHVRAAEPCGRSVFTRIVCTVAFVERAGLVAEGDRFSEESAVLRVQAQLEAELAGGVARVVRKAPRTF